jgi:hypothetical protein
MVEVQRLISRVVQSYVDVRLCAEKGQLNNITLVVSE